jgi:formimidoylglutamate deiminase
MRVKDMDYLWAEQALLPGGWAGNVLVGIGADGRILSVARDQAPAGRRLDILLPAPANVHSHAFQRAMAGLTEQRGPDPADSFWTWRQLMFRFLDRLTPDHVQAITAYVQMEMLEAGYACNTEFHYLHHRPGGLPYDQPAEMAERIAAAAQETGIGLSLLPVHYQFGGCDRRPLGPGQIRFGTTPDAFLALHEACRGIIRNAAPDSVLGTAPHSLRAVSAEGLRQVTDQATGPIHMHVAEQLAEVDEVLAHHGARPVEWILANAGVGPDWCLIHLTQMTASETCDLARTGVVAGLCPITEANLGDGIFDGVRWLAEGGRIGIGSDSNIRIGLSEELRQLEHSQRLRDHSRAALALPGLSTGRRIFDAAVAGGAQAAGRQSGAIVPGVWADLLALDGSSVDLSDRQGDMILDAFIFAGSDDMVCDVWSAGRHLVTEGRHRRREAITAAYRRTMHALKDAL